MSEKQFRVRFEQEDGKGEIVNEKGFELTTKEVVNLLNTQQDTISYQEQKIKILQQEIKDTQAILEMLSEKLKGEDKHGHYRFNEKMQIQKDDDTISFIYDDMVYVFDFESVKMYRVREKPKYSYPISGEISDFENFVLGLFCGVMLMVLLFMGGG